MPARPSVVIVYNEPGQDRYSALGEQKAVLGVLDEVKAVHAALIKLGSPAARLGLTPPIEDARGKLAAISPDWVVFNLFEGFEGRPETEAAVAGMLAECGLAYTGCPEAALALALDKAKTKAVLEAHGLPTPRFQVLTPDTISTFRLTFPCIIKPVAEDASHGLSEESVVANSAALEKQVKKISEQYSGHALVEEFLDGREYNITVLGNRDPFALPSSEIVFKLPPGRPRILTFWAKWEPRSAYYKSSAPVCPADVDDMTRQHIATSAVAAYKLLGCAGYARVDFRAGADGIPQIIEVNPNPDLTPGYGVAMQAEVAGMSYPQVIDRILEFALERKSFASQSAPA